MKDSKELLPSLIGERFRNDLSPEIVKGLGLVSCHC